MRMREHDPEKRRIVSVGEARDFRECDVGPLGDIERQSEIKKNSGAVLFQLDAVAANLLCAAMNAGTHLERVAFNWPHILRL